MVTKVVTGDNNCGDTFDAEDEVNCTNDDHFCANYDDNVVRGVEGTYERGHRQPLRNMQEKSQWPNNKKIKCTKYMCNGI